MTKRRKLRRIVDLNEVKFVVIFTLNPTMLLHYRRKEGFNLLTDTKKTQSYFLHLCTEICHLRCDIKEANLVGFPMSIFIVEKMTKFNRRLYL